MKRKALLIGGVSLLFTSQAYGFTSDPMIYPIGVRSDLERQVVIAVQAQYWSRAVQTATAALSDTSDSVNVLINRGVAYWHLGKKERAFDDWRRAAEMMPRNGEARYNRGLAFWNKGQKKSARNDFEAACSLGIQRACDVLNDPYGLSSVKELLHASATAFQQKNYITVIDLSKRVLAQEPNNPVALTNWCGALVSLGRTDNAMPICNKAIETAPEFGLAYNNFGVAWEQKKDMETALYYYTAACRLNNELGCKNIQRITMN